MQRFHFEACGAIPPKVLGVYKSLKTTRPRGVGSPQSYWDKSARELGLVDSECGILLREDRVGILVKRVDENDIVMEQRNVVGGGAAPIPSLAPVPVEHGPGPWIENGAGPSTPQDDQQVEVKEEDEEGQEKPSEADASILLMLKNPEATSPKSLDDAAEGETKCAEV
jgi:hypothetical protein